MIKIGDKVQWLVNGSDQFLTPKRVTQIVPYENSYYVYVEDSVCAIPIEQVSKVKIGLLKTLFSYFSDNQETKNGLAVI